MIFETERLHVRKVSLEDKDAFFDLMSNPNVMNPIPRPVMTKNESDAFLNKLLHATRNDSLAEVWSVVEKKSNTYIGLCAFLKNENSEDEIGYRLREKFWGIGYGTEITKGLLTYGFSTKKCKKITADVALHNLASIKILKKFMLLTNEFYNTEDQCMDQRYEVLLKDWIKMTPSKLN